MTDAERIVKKIGQACPNVGGGTPESLAYWDLVVAPTIQREVAALTAEVERLQRLDDLHQKTVTPAEVVVHERDAARAEVERLKELTGSFFDALKPLNLPALNVANPGQHVTDLISTLARRDAELAGVVEATRRLMDEPQVDGDGNVTATWNAAYRDLRAALAPVQSRAETVAAVVEAAKRWDKAHVSSGHRRCEMLPMPAACERGTCGVPHDFANEYDAAADHLHAAVVHLTRKGD